MENDAAIKRQALRDFDMAWAFTQRTHTPDMVWIGQRQTLVTTFEDFYREYCYVVVASGFRGRTAARLAPLLAACCGDEKAMLRVFKNKQKCAALARVWRDGQERWAEMRASWRTEDDLCALPRIGPIVKYHLARNIGLRSCVKPDLHIVRYANELYKTERDDGAEQRAQRLVQTIATEHGIAPGVADFALWVWLSHRAARVRTGTKRKRESEQYLDEAQVLECCNGGYRLR